MSYAIRAAYLWQRGEGYAYNGSLEPPMCWELPEPEEGEVLYSLMLGLGAVNPEYIHGSITPDPAPDEMCPPLEGQPWCGLYPEGTEVWLTPVPNPGYVFSHWTGDLSGVQVPALVVINDDKHVLAEFVALSEGEGECPMEGEGPIEIILPDGVPLKMVWIPGGTFLMGQSPGEQDSSNGEKAQHEVTLARSFYMGKYEVTKRQWKAVMGTTPWAGRSNVLDHRDSPAVFVSWDDAQAFITALNTHVADTGQGCATFRLPSESEWEYACRAGTTTRFYWGDDPYCTVIDDYAWWEGTTCDSDYYYEECRIEEWYAHVVGQKLPNAFGLYDMSGNVWEWCEDDWHLYYTGAPTDGSAWVDTPRSIYRVVRGGDWTNHYYSCLSTSRNHYIPTTARNTFGFRLARTN